MKRKGNIPPESSGWKLISQIDRLYGADWGVFRRSQGHSTEWAYYKIVAIDGAEEKANYWMARNDSTGQLGYTRDMAIMRAKRPDLHSRVEAILTKQEPKK